MPMGLGRPAWQSARRGLKARIDDRAAHPASRARDYSRFASRKAWGPHDTVFITCRHVFSNAAGTSSHMNTVVFDCDF